MRDKRKLSRYEVADRKINLCVDDLLQGKELVVSLKIRTLFPVKAIFQNSVAYSYYNPEIRGETNGRDIVVIG